MNEAQLTYYASWASIISLIIALYSLLYLRSIKNSIVKFRRTRRIRHLVMSALAISPADHAEFRAALVALQRNLPVHWWSRFTSPGRIIIALHERIEAGDMVAARELIYDWVSYSEDL